MSPSQNSKASEKHVDDSSNDSDESSDSDDDVDSTEIETQHRKESTDTETRYIKVNDEKKVSAVDNWEDMYERLEQFRNNYGHCLVPNRFEDRQLGYWVARQRRMYRLKNKGRQKSAPMTEREQRLAAIGFEWSALGVQWEERFIELLEFVVENGHAQVPLKWERNFQLSHWVSAQRQEYKKKQTGNHSRITQDRIELLNRIGFVWEAKRGRSQRQRTENGVPVPHTYQETPTGTDKFRRAAKTLLENLRSSNSTSASAVAGVSSNDQEQLDKTDSNTASNLQSNECVAGFNDIAAGRAHNAPNATDIMSRQPLEITGLSPQHASASARRTNPQRLEAPEMVTQQGLLAGYNLNTLSSFAINPLINSQLNVNRHPFGRLSSRSSALSSYNLLNTVGAPMPLQSSVASILNTSNTILPQSLAQQTTISGTAGVDSRSLMSNLFQQNSLVGLPRQQHTVPVDYLSFLRTSPQQQTPLTVMESPVMNHSRSPMSDLFQRNSLFGLPRQQHTVPVDYLSMLRGSSQRQTPLTVMESPVMNHSRSPMSDLFQRISMFGLPRQQHTAPVDPASILRGSLQQQTTLPVMESPVMNHSRSPMSDLFQRISLFGLPRQQHTVPVDLASIFRGSLQQQTTLSVTESPVVNNSANQCDDDHTPTTRKRAREGEDPS